MTRSQRTRASVRKQVETFQSSGFAGLEGSEARLRLVIDEALVNDIVAEATAGRYPALRELRVSLEADNEVKVRVRSTAPLVPTLTLHLEIDREAILHSAPTVRLRIRKHGFSKLVASLLPTLADKLPPEVRLAGENVELDLTTLLGRWDVEWLLPLLVTLEIETRREQLRIAVELRA